MKKLQIAVGIIRNENNEIFITRRVFRREVRWNFVPASSVLLLSLAVILSTKGQGLRRQKFYLDLVNQPGD